MSKDRRRHTRHDVNYACWVAPADGTDLFEGKVINISEGGAKVACSSHPDADTIDLYMTRDGKVGRRCKVVWRSEDAVGLMFVAKATLRHESGTVEI